MARIVSITLVGPFKSLTADKRGFTSSIGRKFSGGIATKCFPSPRPAMTVKPMLCAREKNKAAKITQSSGPRSFIRLPLRYMRLATTTADISHVSQAHAMMSP